MALDTSSARAHLRENNGYRNGIIKSFGDGYKDLYVVAPNLDPHGWACPDGWGAFPANEGDGVGFVADPTYVMAIGASKHDTAPETVGEAEHFSGVYAIADSPGAAWIQDEWAYTEVTAETIDDFDRLTREYNALTGESKGTSDCGNNEDTQMTDNTLTLGGTDVNANEVLDALNQFYDVSNIQGEAASSGSVVIAGDEDADTYVYVFVDGTLVTEGHNVIDVTDVMKATDLREMVEDATEQPFVDFLESELPVTVTAVDADERVWSDGDVDAEVRSQYGAGYFGFSQGQRLDDHDDVGIRYIDNMEDGTTVVGIVDGRDE